MNAPRTPFLRLRIPACAALFVTFLGVVGASDENTPTQNAVQAIFDQRCVKCHGSKKQKGGLRLDLPNLAALGGDSGASFVASKPDESLLITKVTSSDPDEWMPPKGKRLSGEEVGVLREWIKQYSGKSDSPGKNISAPPEERAAVESDHWSFQPIVRPTPPTIANDIRSQNEIDAFVLSRLQEEGLSPSPPADRATLIRRLYLDLLGLPPTPEEVDSFVTDTGDDAWSRVVDRVLDDDAFGERWARHWLDLARYADSDGYEKDGPRPNAWRWREWVINAINDDLPYDQFVVEQLAGDLLPGASADQHLATGFHRNTLTNLEGGVDQEEYRVEAVRDRVDTTTSALMALTMGCAKCHSHKYDPLTQREYYGFFAFFNSDDEVNSPVNPTEREKEEHQRKIWEHQRQELDLLRELSQFRKEVDAEVESLRQSIPNSGTHWTTLDPVTFATTNGSTLTELDDHSVRASGENPEKEDYEIVLVTDLTSITGLKLDALTDPETGLVGRTPHGNYVLSEFEVEIGTAGDPASFQKVELQEARANHSQVNYPIAHAIDGKLGTGGWAVQPHYTSPHQATFKPRTSFGKEEGTALRIRLKQHHGTWHTLAHFRIQATVADPHFLFAEDDLLTSFRKDSGERSPEEHEALRMFARSVLPATRELHQALEQHQAKSPTDLTPMAATLARREDLRETNVLIRGSFLDRGDAVAAHTPAVLPPLIARGDSSDRLDLALWIIQKDQPLTARVAANRIWYHLFGRGLVSTLDDFGTRGEKPTHPALLDWLATEYRDRGYSRKAFIRKIVHSATYRQRSDHRAELTAVDPQNLLLARQQRLRVEGEVVRDLHLAVSGLLAHTVGGPSVRPPLPSDVANIGYANSIKWPVSKGEDRYRRGIYTFAQRTVPYPMLETFDCADASTSTARRESSNTPIQALTALNDPTFFECAVKLADQMIMDENTNDHKRMQKLFRLCLSRSAAEGEIQPLVTLLESVRERRGEKEAWTAVARTLFNTDEFITRG